MAEYNTEEPPGLPPTSTALPKRYAKGMRGPWAWLTWSNPSSPLRRAIKEWGVTSTGVYMEEDSIILSPVLRAVARALKALLDNLNPVINNELPPCSLEIKCLSYLNLGLFEAGSEASKQTKIS